MTRQASIRFAGLAFDKLLGYVFALLIAKTYGSSAFGLYIFGIGLFEVAYALTELGLERASIRAVADLGARGRFAEIKGVVRSTLLLTVPFGTVLAIVTVIFAPHLSSALGQPDLAPFLQLAAIAIPASLVADNHLWVTEALGYQRYTVIARMVVEPSVKILVAVALYVPFEATTEAGPLAIAYGAAITTSAAIAYGIYGRTVASRAVGEPTEHHAAELLRVGLPVCGLNLLQRFLSWWDVFLIFTFVSSAATTHYAVAFRTATLTFMVAAAFDAAFKPRIASALALDRRDELAREFRTISRAILALCLPAIVMFVAFPTRVTQVLGGQFAASGPVVTLVAIGTLVSYLAGPAASALTMAGRSRLPLANGATGGAAGVIVGLSLVTPLGPIGVAIGQLTSMTVSNALNAIAARRHLGIVAIGRDHLKLLAAVIAAVAVGWLADHYAPEDRYLAFAAVGSAVLCTYTATLGALGIHPDDWTMIRGAVALLRRSR